MRDRWKHGWGAMIATLLWVGSGARSAAEAWPDGLDHFRLEDKDTILIFEICTGVDLVGVEGCSEIKTVRFSGPRPMKFAIDEGGFARIAKLEKLDRIDFHNLTGLSEGAIAALGPAWERVKELKLNAAITDDATIGRLPAKKLEVFESYATTLKSRPGDATAKMLATNPHLCCIRIFTSSGITDQGFVALGDLKELRVLYLPYCQITDASATALGQLTKLEELDLEGAKISDASAGALAKLGGLRQLRLGRTKVSWKTLAVLAAMKNLAWLDMTGTAVEDEGLSMLSELTAVEALTLDWTKIKGSGLSAVAKMKGLKMLSLNHTTVDDAEILALVDELPETITSLGLQGTKVTDEAVVALAKRLPKLESIDIGCTVVTDAGIKSLLKINSVKYIYATGSGISAEMSKRISGSGVVLRP